REQLNKTPRPPGALDGRAKHPQAQHIAEPVPELKVQKTVSQQLPHPSMEDDLGGGERQIDLRKGSRRKMRQFEHESEQKNSGINPYQPRYRPSERGQA